MPQFLIPILTALLMGIVGLILRYLENKMLHGKAQAIDSYLKVAKEAGTMLETNEKIQDAMDMNDTLLKKLNPNGLFKKIAKILLLFISFNSTAAITVPRVETNITTSTDSINFIFTIYNDGTDTAFIGSLLITTIIDYSLCDSGHAITYNTPTITDTSLHPLANPYILVNKGIYQFVYNFKSSNRLVSPPGSSTQVGTATLYVTNSTGGCQFKILYSTANTPSFIGYATTQTSSQIRNTDWWRFFITPQ